MNIRKRRESLGLSQEELGRLAGVSYATISRLERGLRVPQKSNDVDEMGMAKAYHEEHGHKMPLISANKRRSENAP